MQNVNEGGYSVTNTTHDLNLFIYCRFMCQYIIRTPVNVLSHNKTEIIMFKYQDPYYYLFAEVYFLVLMCPYFYYDSPP